MPTSQDTTTLSTGRTVHLAIGGLALIAVCYGLARFAYGLFVPAFRSAFDLDAAAAGLIASGSYGAYCIGIFAATATTPRLGARVVAVGAGVLATAGTALIAFAPDALVLAAGVMLAGSSTGVASPPLAHAVAKRVSAGRRDRVQTIVNAGTGLGVMVSGPVALLAQEQWRVAWIIFAVICALVTAWMAVLMPAARDGAPGRRGERHAWLPTGAGRLLLAAGTMGLATAAVWTFGQDILTAEGGHDRTFATIAWIVLGACGLIGATAGDLAGRIGLARSWTLLMVGAAAATLAIGVLPGSGVAAIVASGVFGAVYIALTGILLVWSTRVYADVPARGVGVAFLALALGQAVGAPLLGGGADAAGLPAAFVAAAAVALIGALVRPPAGRHRPRRTAGQPAVEARTINSGGKTV
ncbi:MFS transporter [Microbacterium sp. 179-B 1A2 NHS]|uniref:MFS transporter n=1 Tax=Microbacterium sp. 179-B 1A2 NHS TaxID=3142383 RepID=UPI0039A246E8